MELKQLITFRIAADNLNFSKTAITLNYAQSSVTAQIQALEAELDVQLFERLGKRIILTEAGRKFKLYADKITLLTEEAKTVVRGGTEPHGTLVIGAPESLCTYRLPPLLIKFRASFPHVQLRFYPVVSDLELFPLLADGTIDAAFMLGQITSSDMFIMEPIIKEPISIITHPEHPLTNKKSVYAIDLTGESFMLTGKDCSYRRIFENYLHPVKIQPTNLIEFSSIEAIKQCTISGMGISVLPQVAVKTEVELGLLKELAWNGGDISVVIQLVRHKDKWISPALQAFLDITHDYRSLLLKKSKLLE